MVGSVAYRLLACYRHIARDDSRSLGISIDRWYWMLTIRAMSDGKGYSARHLEHSDYYAEGERVVGRWQGRGAQLLGLEGDVRGEAFEALRQGLDPQSGEFLRQRHGADRIGLNGETRSQARHLYDFTF